MDKRLWSLSGSLLILLLLAAMPALAQNPPAGQNAGANGARNRPKQKKPPRGQLNVVFTSSLSSDASRQFPVGPTTKDAPDNAFGFLAGYALNLSKWASLEGSYGFSRKTQNYSSTTASISGASSAAIQSNAHEFGGAFVFRLPPHHFKAKPFGMMGLSGLMFSPNAASKALVAGAQTQTKEAFVYGGGVDYPLNAKLGIRGEYRGMLVGEPDFHVPSLVLRSTIHQAGPSVGMYYKF
jgi:opacity protein-like surface antigen